MQLTNFPQKELARGFQSVPNVLTTIPGATKDTYIFQLVVSNPTAGSINFTLQDLQGTPAKLYSATPIAAGANLFMSTEDFGVLFKGGAQWLGSATGLVAEIVATVVG